MRIGRIPIGRAAIVGGGGPGLFVEQLDDASLVNDAVQTWSSRSTHVGVQSLAAVEVRVIDCVTAFVGARAELSSIDTLVAYPTAGMRIGF